MKKLIVLLRGINVGGNNMIKMEDLKKMFVKIGYENPKTLLATGNVLIESDKNIPEVKESIEKYLFKALGFEIKVLVRPLNDVQEMIKRNPFKTIKPDKSLRLYVTFISEIPKNKTKIKLSDFEILDVTDTEVYWVIRIKEAGKTPESMTIIEKQFGKYSTTRNWNTVIKIGRM